MTLIGDAAAGAAATPGKEKPMSLHLQSRRLPFLMNQLPLLFAVTPGTTQPRMFVEGIMKGNFGSNLLLNDFGKVKKNEVTIQAQFNEKKELDTLLEHHGDTWYLAFGGPWGGMWQNQRTALRSGDWSGSKFKASYLLHKLNHAMVEWTDQIRTCMHDAVVGFDFKLVSEVYRYFVDFMDSMMNTITWDDQLSFIERVAAGLHPDDALFGKRPPAVVTPDKDQTRGKRRDEEVDETQKGKTKKPRARRDPPAPERGEDNPPAPKSDVCDWHLLFLLGVKNRDTYQIEEKRGKVIECRQGNECRNRHPDTITKAAALNIVTNCSSHSFLNRFKKQALEAAEKLG